MIKAISRKFAIKFSVSATTVLFIGKMVRSPGPSQSHSRPRPRLPVHVYEATKSFLLVLRCFFHLEKLVPKKGARLPLSHLSTHLSTSITPAFSNIKVVSAIRELNLKWAASMTDLLADHYRSELNKASLGFSDFHLSEDEWWLARGRALEWFVNSSKIRPQLSILNKWVDCISICNPARKVVASTPSSSTSSTSSTSSKRVLSPSSPSPLGKRVTRSSSYPSLSPCPSTPPSTLDSSLSSPPVRPLFSVVARSQPAPSTAPRLSEPSRLRPTAAKGCSNTHHRRAEGSSSWRLPSLDREVCIVGDSNLSRIPISSVSKHPIQVESFSGCSIEGLTKLLKFYSFSSIPRVLIFSVGINNRCSSNPAYLKKALQALHSTASRIFPHSRILFLSLNFSKNLSSSERSTLELIDSFASQVFCSRCIPSLPSSLISFQRDSIHWAPESADRVLSHILSHLN